MRQGQPSDLDDWVAIIAEFASGASGVLESSKLASGRNESWRSLDYVELNGSEASFVFFTGKWNELQTGKVGGHLVCAGPEVRQKVLALGAHGVGNAGARGFVLKGARQNDIRRAIHAAHAGDAIITGGIARRLASLVADPAAAVATTTSPANHAFPDLTDRELEVLRELSHGADNTAIARTLFLSEKTVRNYVSTVLVKLGVTSRTAAALAGRDAGL